MRSDLGDDLLQDLAHAVNPVGAEALGPAGLDVVNEPEAHALGVHTLLGEANQLGAAVLGVWDALDVAELDQVVHDLAHRLLRHVRVGGELGQAHAVVADEAKDAAVGRAEVGVAGLLELPAELAEVGLGRGVEQTHERGPLPCVFRVTHR